jgi:predicted kinase
MNLKGSKMPTLYMMVGLPGAGKTTTAKQMEREKRILRLSPDEWIAPIFGTRDHIDNPKLANERRDRIEALQWDMAARLLALGMDVILENGFWSKAERQMYRARAEAVGAKVKICFCDASREELLSRINRRNKEPNAFVTSEKDLDSWLRVFEPPTADELG